MSIFTVTCPSCETQFPIDPAKVPSGGVRARCSVCGGIFPVDHPDPGTASAAEADAPPTASAAPAATAAPAEPPEPAEPPVSTADRLGDAAFPEAGPEPDARPEPWSGVDDELGSVSEQDTEPAPGERAVDEAVPGAEFEASFEFEVGEVVEAEPEPEGAVEPELEPEFVPEPEFASEPEPEPDVVPASDAEVRDEPIEASWAPDDASEVVADPPAAPPQEAAPLPQSFQFGRRDPHDKARRLARVLVSDIITYNPERYLRALENDTLVEDFDEEIRKSWNEYVEQVGSEMARETSYWTEALNDLLARGRDVF